MTDPRLPALLQLIARARLSVKGGTKLTAGQRLYQAIRVQGEGDPQLVKEMQIDLTTFIIGQLGYAELSVFQAKATLDEALKALDLLEARYTAR